jgi:hypothetical protein
MRILRAIDELIEASRGLDWGSPGLVSITLTLRAARALEHEVTQLDARRNAEPITEIKYRGVKIEVLP